MVGAREGVMRLAVVDNGKPDNQQLKNLKNKGHDLERRVLQKDMCGLYTNKLDNLDEIDKFIETHNLPRWKHKQIENLSRLLISKEVESSNKNLPTKKSPDDFTNELYQTFK